ncbi:MAG: (2Fe-2S)-binding protein [Acidobacteriota bacterium]|jgi:aerobic-type carbon monoxide dehydrogenase small subunit (CoxS/CutS family)
MAEFTINVNGRDHTIDVPPDMPLLWALRDTLGMTGTKYGCGMELCGACTVHIDGEPVRACRKAVSTVGAGKVTTIEGLAGDHPVIDAWIAEDVPQCGYCQVGQVMTAAALLASNPDPSDDDIDAAMVGVVCRCGTYDRIRKAIRRAAGRVAP